MSDALRDWCVDTIARLVDRPGDEIDPDASFASLGLDSANSVQFVLALEDYLGRELDPDLVEKHPSINQVRQALLL